MHYVLKNKLKDGLVAAAEDLSDEFYRAQKQVLSVDQNNIGNGGSPLAYVPGSPAPIATGITYTAFAPPTSGEGEVEYKSLTRWHYDRHAGASTNVSESGVWTDQKGYADISFRAYRTSPYLIYGFVQLAQEVNQDSGNPLRASVSVRVDGEVLQPEHTVGFANTQTGAGNYIYAPVLFYASKVLAPGMHRATVTVRQNAGKTLQISNPAVAAIGLVR